MNIGNAVKNAINSMFKMIIAVDSVSMTCSVLDCNDCVSHLAADDKDFSLICERLFINIHPEDRASFLEFTDPNFFPVELKNKVYKTTNIHDIICLLKEFKEVKSWLKN